MNLFLREMKSNFKSLIIWSVCFAFLIVVGMIKFTTTGTDPKLFADVINQVPRFIRALFGFGNFDVSTLIGFYGIVNFYIILLAAVHSSFVASHTISKEEQEKTTEFLNVKPISRAKIIFLKLSAVFVNVLIINIVSAISSVLIMNYMSNGDSHTNEVIMMMVYVLIVQIIFLFIGSAIATLSRRPKLAAARGTIVLVAAYLLSSLIDMFKELEFLKYLTPFKYFNTADVLVNKPIDFIMVFITVFVVAGLCALTFKGYEKRDL